MRQELTTSEEEENFTYDFIAGQEHWQVDLPSRFIRITDTKSGDTLKYSHDLGQLCQLEDFRIAAYEGTYAMIGVSVPVDDKKSVKLPPMKHDRHSVDLIWLWEGRVLSDDEAG